MAAGAEQRKDVSMMFGVVADFVSLARNAAGQIRVPGDPVTDTEKCGAHAMPGQQVQHGGRNVRVRAIVDG